MAITSLRRRVFGVLVPAVGVGLYSFLAYRSAWVSDDAFISLRTVSNVLHGYGLRWNVDERVQSFTHPLWLFVLTVAHALTNEPFYSTLYVSWLISTAAIALLLFASPATTGAKLIALAVLIVSRAFMDFSSSGLENPLTHTLIIGFVMVWVRRLPGVTRARMLSSIVGLAALNRLDTALIFGPALIVDALRQRRWLCYVPAAIPVGIWEIFSVVYYGFPFPNTAYAKLTQAQVEAPIIHGLHYLYASLQSDPITLVTIASCIAAAVLLPDRDRLCLTSGAALYLVYAVRVGGDFMSGRFLSAPLCMCVACLATSDWLNVRRANVPVAAAAVASFALLGHWSPLPRAEDFIQKPIETYIDQFGIHDERRLFFAIDSLSNASQMNPLMPDHPWSRIGVELRARASEHEAHVVEAIGHAGYFAGPEVHLIDHWALSDALIARLPATHGKYGHYPRVVPDGYLETLSTHHDHFVDRNLAAYYDRLASVIRGPEWSWARFKTIGQLNVGTYQYLIDRYAYVHSQQVSIQVQFANPGAHSCVLVYVWNDARVTSYELDRASHAGQRYRLAWRLTPSGATLLFPAGLTPAVAFSGLRKSGFFAVSIAFTDRVNGPIKEVHELRYTYRIERGRLIVQKQPWPAWNGDFPAGPWHDGLAPAAELREVTE